jgi:predicted nuclease with TOPRIM domain
MNKESRKELKNIVVEINSLQERITNCKSSEQKSFENIMHENLQFGKRGKRIEENISYLKDSWNDLKTAIYNIKKAIK